MFTTLVGKLAGTKGKLLAGAAIAGAALMLAAPAAQAQRVRFGVTIGAPVYMAPAPQVVYAGPGYYDGYYVRDYDGWRARYWDQRFDRRDFDRRDFDRDRGFDRDRHFDRDHDRRFDRR